MNNVMLDLETVGTRPGCGILSIGAVAFDFKANKLGDHFYQAIEPESNKNFGLVFDPDTLAWWQKQSEEARAVWNDPNAIALDEALHSFSQWCRMQASIDSFYLWGNGANFDDPVLAAAYHATAIPLPWKFWNSRCYRTLKSLAPAVFVKKPDIAHNALSDAVSQASGALLMWQGLMKPAAKPRESRAAKAVAKKMAPQPISQAAKAAKKARK